MIEKNSSSIYSSALEVCIEKKPPYTIRKNVGVNKSINSWVLTKHCTIPAIFQWNNPAQCATMLVEHRRHALVIPVGMVLQQRQKQLQQTSRIRISQLLSCFDCSICLSSSLPSFVATYTIQKEFNRQSWINGRNLPQQKKHKWHLTSIKAIQVHCAGQSALTCGSCSACWLDFENKYQPIIKKFLYDLSNLTQYVFEYWLKVFGI